MWDPPNAKSGQAYAGTKFYWNVLGVLLGVLYSLARMIAVKHQRTATRGPLQDRTKKKIGRIKHVETLHTSLTSYKKVRGRGEKGKEM